MPESAPYLIAGACLVLLALALAGMGTLHEAHYRDRRRRLLEAHLRGLELRLEAVESILREDRML